jgi:transposase InsO family protein
MDFTLHPWQLYFLIMAGWVNRQQQVVIDYLRTENQVLREKLGKKRILLNDDQRRRLAVKGRFLGRKLLQEIGTIFTPDTILRWHRQLVAKKWDYTLRREKKPGRPRVRQVIVNLTLRFAKENPSWGYDRIQGALANVGYPISDTTVENILKAHGVEPAPDRQRTGSWSTFLKAHWDVLAAIDFTTVEVWTKGGLVTYYLLFVMELKTRRVHFAGCTTSPNEAWMKQIARNLTDPFDGFLLGKRIVLMDRDGKFCPAFRKILKDEDADPLLLPPRSPNLNAYIERFMRSIKSETLSRMIFFGEKSLRRAVAAFLDHYHAERNHQGLANELIQTGDEVGSDVGAIDCRERLGGMLKYYYRKAA